MVRGVFLHFSDSFCISDTNAVLSPHFQTGGYKTQCFLLDIAMCKNVKVRLKCNVNVVINIIQ